MHTITPATAFDHLTDQAVIDGYTQPGSSANTLAVGDDAVLRIELDGTNVGSGDSGLFLSGGHSTLRGLVLNRWSASAVRLDQGGNNVVEGNFIGTDPTGMTIPGASSTLVYVSSVHRQSDRRDDAGRPQRHRGGRRIRRDQSPHRGCE